ncbi:diversity-generating retroelement protein Avd [Leptothoe spongobia]|uniref:Diversity-generating retroelement protein Avd n=1 Tax=Leptothoe spongobia TAU-MAC 1115 TaxID=1967444 RepID=A0A947DE25_9CYAN|nr:diversity-generating retroelement protein Avd [Leptothoe spongobia]MBT9314899.1 diversity-generating retroelement protein Avd [Leptothoe spongobia TAU-MAC 1115]
MSQGKELPIIQKTYDLIKWYVPILQKLPRNHRFQLGDRVINGLYDLLETLVVAQYQQDKLDVLQALNSKLDVLRYQTRLLFEFNLLSTQRYTYVSELVDGIGNDLGGWIKQQQAKQAAVPPRKPQAKPILKPVLA